MKKPTQLVLLGGGCVSVWAYRSLVKCLKTELANGSVEITVICPNTQYTFYGWTVETLTDSLLTQNKVIPLAEIMPKARLIRGQATALDTANKTVYVRLPDGSQQVMITYDQLLLGIGAVDSEAIDGIRQDGYQLKARDAFQRTKATIQSLVKRAANENPTMARNLLTFLVAGGGFTGVELATNLVEYISVLKKQYPSLRDIDPHVRLVHSGERVLPALKKDSKRLVRYAEKTIFQYGIEVINNRRITKITANGAYLQDGSFLAASMVISTIGQSRIQLLGTEMMIRDDLRRLHTNSYLQIPGYPTIWGGGDACHVKHFYSGETCPADALWAIKHGDYAGRNMARSVKGQQLRPFTYRGLGQLASLGIGKGITELYGIQFTGLIAWLIRWVLFNYLMPSRTAMFRGIGDWLFLAFRKQRKGVWLEQEEDVRKSQTKFDAVLIP